MPNSGLTEEQHEQVERRLPPDMALLLTALRGEFDAKISRLEARLLTRLAVMGIPLGAAGGFAAEWIRTGSPQQAVAFILPFV